MMNLALQVSLAGSLLMVPTWTGTHALGRPAAPAPAALTQPAPHVLYSAHEFEGCYIRTPSGRRQILQLVWGVSRDHVLIPAYFEMVDEQGRVFVRDHREEVRFTLDSLQEMGGFFIQLYSASVWVNDLRFGVDSNGTLILAGLDGFLPDGRAFTDGAVGPGAMFGGVTPACTATPTVSCTTGACTAGTGSNCNGGPSDPECTCVTQTEKCGSSATFNCDPTAECDPGETCKVKTDGSGCDCRPDPGPDPPGGGN